MLSHSEVVAMADICASIGNELAEDNGFVPIRKLLERFQSSLVVRPLLVDGMIASADSVGTAPHRTSWTIFIDSETYRVDDDAISAESSISPLPLRARNTIAHELVHTLAFRPSEFGIRFKGNISSGEERSEFVKQIEQETEKLSPCLLWSEKSMELLFAQRKQALGIEDLTKVCRTMGISRAVLINRLRLLRMSDRHDYLHHDALRNLAIGLAEWSGEGKASLRSWPLFVNFDRNIVPLFLATLGNQDRLPASEIFLDPGFAMCGGLRLYTGHECTAGTTTFSADQKLKIECIVEDTEKKKGDEFFFVVRKTDL